MRRKPDVEGPYGRAWRLATPKPEHAACLGSWIVNVPGAHPFWEHWLVALVHLRDVPGIPPAHKKYTSAEFEFSIQSINPETCPEPDPDKSGDGYPLLRPIDVVEQFHGLSDHDAQRVVDRCIEAMLHGRISPDQDARTLWNLAIQETVAHFRSGKHPEN
jgi:hypothetical protein